MYRVLCKLVDGELFTEYTRRPEEAVKRFFTAYKEEVYYVEVDKSREETESPARTAVE